MAYNEKLADRVREILSNQRVVEEKKMMGSLTFMVNGKMCVGVLKDDLMARINPEIYETVLQKKGCREMDFTGKPMKGFVFVGPSGTSNKGDLSYWVNLTLDFNKKAKSYKKGGESMNKVVHFEIPADNLGRAEKFYKEVFGWGINKVPPMPGGDEYLMVTTVETDEKQMPKEAGAINGGLMKRTPDMKGSVIVINVPNLEEHLKKIEQAGGKVVVPTQKVMDMGLYARVSDTEGNVIGIWQDLK